MGGAGGKKKLSSPLSRTHTHTTYRPPSTGRARQAAFPQFFKLIFCFLYRPPAHGANTLGFFSSVLGADEERDDEETPSPSGPTAKKSKKAVCTRVKRDLI